MNTRNQLDFGAKAASYVDTFMSAVRWGNVDRVFNEVTGHLR
jgi:hypothetical protein